MPDDTPHRRSDPDRARQPPATAPGQAPRIPSACLFRGGRRLVIDHNGQNYVLQITRAGRLILTK